MAAKGVEIANAYVAITVGAPGVKRDIERELGAVNARGAGTQIADRVASGMKTAMKAAGAGVAAVLGTALVKGFGRLKAIETAQAKMRGLGHDAATVSKAMDNSLAAVKGTAFGLGDAATAAGQLMAANIKPGRQLEGVLKTVGNNASAAGVQFDEMGSIFAKAATQANGVQNDILAQLADKGIPIYQAIAKEAGVTAGEVFKMASEGEISFDMFQRAATAAAGTVADEMGKTTTGSFDNMIAALGRLGAKLLEDIYPIIGPTFRSITTWLDAAAAKVEPILGGLSAVVGLFKDGNFSAQLRTAFGWEEDSGIVTFLLGLRTTAINVFTEVAGGIRAFGAAFQSGGTDVTSSGFAGFLERAGLVARFLWDTLTTKLIPGLIAFGAWVIDNRDWISALALAVGGAVVGMKAWSAATTAWATVTKAAGAVQAAWIAGVKAHGAATTASGKAQAVFNAILGANPIVKIVMLIGGLVTALVYFFTQTKTGQKIWGEFTRFLGEAWANVSAFFVSIYEQYLKPVFDGIAQVATWLWSNILQPVFQFIQVGFAIVGGILAGIWEYILRPVFEGLGKVVTWLWSTILKPYFGLIVAQVKIAGAIFRWLYANVVQPVFAAIGRVFSWLWTNIVQPIFQKWIMPQVRALGALFSWLYQNAIKPALDGAGFAMRWLYANVVQPVWNGIKSTIAAVWTNGIKPVIDTLVRVIKTDPKKAFEAARDGIGLAWKAIQQIAAKPVRFVIKTVLNEGLIAGINTILPKALEIPDIPLPKGFAGGGVLPGYMAAKRDDVLMPMRSGEGVLVPEVVRGLGPGFVHALNAVGNSGGVGAVRKRFAGIGEGLARGGMVDPLPRGSFSVSQPWHGGHNGIDLAAPAGTKVMAAADGVVQLAGVVPMGGNEIYVQHTNGLGTRYSHLSRFATSVGRKVKQGNVIGYVGSTGMSTGPHLHYMVHDPGRGPGSYYPNMNPAGYMGRAGKVLGEAGGAGGAASVLSGFGDLVTSKIKEAFPGGGWAVDVAMGIAQTAAEKLTKHFSPFAASDGHTGTATLYDRGGQLPTGFSLVENRSGVPEHVLTGAQWDSLLANQGASLSGMRVWLVLEDGRELAAYVDERGDLAVERGIDDMETARRHAGV